MKPVVIIAISVGCSVVAVLGVLVALEMYAVNEAQKAYAIELERQAVCERLYDGYAQSLRDTELWGICINYGIINAVNDEVSDCGNSQSYSTQLCKIDTKILAMKVVNEELTLDEKFRDSFTKDLDTLQVTRQKLLSDRQIEEQQNKIKFEEMKRVKEVWSEKFSSQPLLAQSSIYQECMDAELVGYDTEFLHSNFCKDMLQDSLDCNRYHSSCKIITNNIINGIPLWSGTEDFDESVFESYSNSCNSNPYSDYESCMCGSSIDSVKWIKLCVGRVK